LQGDQVTKLYHFFAQFEDEIHVGQLGTLAAGTSYEGAVEALTQQVILRLQLLVSGQQLTLQFSVFVEGPVRCEF